MTTGQGTVLAGIGIVRCVAVGSSGDHKVARCLNSVDVGQPSRDLAVRMGG